MENNQLELKVVSFGKADREDVLRLLLKAKIPFISLSNENTLTSLLVYKRAYFHSIEGARRVIEIYQEQKQA